MTNLIKEIFQNDRVIKAFLKNNQNLNLYLKALNDPSRKHIQKLNQAFQFFYFEIRFRAYVSKNLYFYSINFDKKRKKECQSELTLDQPLKIDEAVTFKDMMIAERNDPILFYIEQTNRIEERIENIHLYHAVKKLTYNQKSILYLAYAQNLSDTEIAIRLNKSQQAVSKARSRAIKKLRLTLKGRVLH